MTYSYEKSVLACGQRGFFSLLAYIKTNSSSYTKNALIYWEFVIDLFTSLC
ncbi:MAG: hypothetical protein PWQ91_207 [Eubacteriales bacterium]|nr:hypothetical protein [Eubacteriales bacterium]MDN5363146.1 hypothetical protein [Eubacteriales bacterium]